MKFVDEIEIRLQAGHGGAGCVSFHRAKYQPRGGPDGGDGGRGGDVYIRANPSIQTLGKLLKKKRYAADDGFPGKGARRTGADAGPLYVEVPLGTRIEDAETGELLGDIMHADANILVARGGIGGQGNQHFATSVKQAPEYAQPGMPGEDKYVRLTLKLLADVGLVGLPNAGKSTLLSRVSRNHPRIAAYAFTTLTPNIGVIENDEYRRLLLADIPGIIEGASRGAGLGLSFLRHIERVGLLLYVIDIGGVDPAGDLRVLRQELESYSSGLPDRPALIVLNKLDLADYDEAFVRDVGTSLASAFPETDSMPEIFAISASESQGLEALKAALFERLPGPTFAEQLLEKGTDSADSDLNQRSSDAY